VPSNQQRRDAERRRLQQELEQRRVREAARKRTTLILSIVGTLVLIAAVVIVIVATTGSDKKSNNAGGNKSNPSASTSTTPAASSSAAQPPAVPAPTTPCSPPSGATATFKGVTIGSATDLKKAPKVTSKGTTAAGLLCEDLVVGKGAAATPTSTVNVQYTGVLYTNGTEFDSSWSKGGKPVQFPLTGVVPGFTQGIGGAGKVAPMHVGGRRVMILPASLGYGAQANGPIPANSTLVFVVDLVSIGG
jgi:FKBP-type peptidyl-prolyl cis-trans isomerase